MAFTIDFGVLLDPVQPLVTKPAELSTKEKKKMKKWNLAKSGRLVRKAAAIMEDKGYTTRSLSDSKGYCVRGAVNYAWCGNPFITDNGEYELTSGIMLILGRRVPQKRNPQVIQAIADFRDFLEKNGHGRSVEAFNDGTKDKAEVIRWMRKFADEVDPQK